MRKSNSSTHFISQAIPERLVILIVGCAPIGIEPVTFDSADNHVNHCVTDAQIADTKLKVYFHTFPTEFVQLMLNNDTNNKILYKKYHL